MICWYCYWGWAKAVADIYAKALEALGGDNSALNYGPAHIVWDDENFDSAEWCLEHFDEYRFDHSDEDLEIVKQSLIELAAIPMEDRCIEPDDYDEMHPELFPPADGVEVVQPIASTGMIGLRLGEDSYDVKEVSLW